jgi:hypothetical protein
MTIADGIDGWAHKSGYHLKSDSHRIIENRGGNPRL